MYRRKLHVSKRDFRLMTKHIINSKHVSANTGTIIYELDILEFQFDKASGGSLDPVGHLLALKIATKISTCGSKSRDLGDTLTGKRNNSQAFL